MVITLLRKSCELFRTHHSNDGYLGLISRLLSSIGLVPESGNPTHLDISLNQLSLHYGEMTYLQTFSKLLSCIFAVPVDQQHLVWDVNCRGWTPHQKSTKCDDIHYSCQLAIHGHNADIGIF